MTYPRIVVISGILFVLVLLSGLMVVQLYDQDQLAQQRRALTQVAASHAQVLQRQLERSLSATLAMASLIRQFKDIQDFEIVAADIIESYGGLKWLALAPGGVVAAVYPALENESEVGRDLLQDPLLGVLAQTAIDQRQLTVSAPLALDPKTQTIIAQLPVFLPDDVGHERLWGFALAVVDVQGVIEAGGLQRLIGQGYEYELRFSTGGNVLDRSFGFNPQQAVQFEAEMPNGAWTLSVSGDIVGVNPLYLGGAVALAVAFSALVAALAYALLRQPLVLRRQVAIRTEELSQANRRLEVEVEERKRAEDKYRDLFENANDGIFLLDRQGRFTSLNRQTERLLGFSKEEIMGRRYHIVVAPQDRAKARRSFIRNLRGRLQTVEVSLRTKHGERVVVEVGSRPISQGGRIVGIQGIARDITERKALEQMKDEFVSTVSHELRTPLTSIKGYTELMMLQQNGPLDEQQREYLDILMRNAKRLTGLIDDLLDMAKLDAGQLQLKLRRLDIGEVLAEVLEAFQLKAEEKGIGLSLETQPGLAVSGDYERLVQVFSNLVSNAIKYTRRGRVRVCASAQDGSVKVAVEDTGVGIAPEDVSQLFQKFFRASDAYIQATAGTGLGLAISKTIVERHHGHIQVCSEPGKGSVFSVLLPRVV